MAGVDKMIYIWPHQFVWTYDNFLRRLGHNPDKLFGPFVKPGMRVMDVGCGAGFAVLGMAKLVGQAGKGVAVDVRPEMLAKVEKRIQKAELKFGTFWLTYFQTDPNFRKKLLQSHSDPLIFRIIR
jgi:SAM-dependent methyltransferase